MIGAESFGFGTAPMVALGCKYLRICHLNNCATGVATQHNVLRSKYFIGLPEMVINYFKFVAQECREILASLGVRTMAELIGHTELLEILLHQAAHAVAVPAKSSEGAGIPQASGMLRRGSGWARSRNVMAGDGSQGRATHGSAWHVAPVLGTRRRSGHWTGRSGLGIPS